MEDDFMSGDCDIDDNDMDGTLQKEGVVMEQKYIESFDGLKILYRKFTPADSKDIKASLILVHGFGEHSGRFIHVAESLCEIGMIVHTIDLRGHGLSGGPRADGKIDWFMKDLRVLHKLAAESPHLPLFFYGHSMGGLLVLMYLIMYPHSDIVATIICSPLLRLSAGKHPSLWKQLLLKMFGGILKEILIESNVDPCSLSACGDEVTKVFNDRLVLPFMTLRFAKEMFEAVEFVHRNALRIQHPLLILHGDRDAVTDHDVSLSFLEKISSVDKSFFSVPGGMHELHNDVDRLKVLEIIKVWLAKRLERALTCGDNCGRWAWRDVPHTMSNHFVRQETIIPNNDHYTAIISMFMPASLLTFFHTMTSATASVLNYLIFWPFFLFAFIYSIVQATIKRL